MRNNVLELLSLLNGEKALGQKTLFFLFLALLRLEVCVHTHKTSHSAHILIGESL